jgi:tyrosine-protein phosphatase SIW14
MSQPAPDDVRPKVKQQREIPDFRIKTRFMFLTRRCLFVSFVLALPALAASTPGIKNFDQVDTHVYRGGQPTTQGFQLLAILGVKTVIDLREPGGRSQAEEHVVTTAGMTYINVPMSGLTPPTDYEIGKILDLLENTSSGPVFVHCLRGADRTGAVIAAYHIDHDKWDNMRALKDAKAHGMSFFQLPRQSFIVNFRSRSEPSITGSQSDATVTATSAPETQHRQVRSN